MARQDLMCSVPDDEMFASLRKQCLAEEGWICSYNKRGMCVWMKPEDKSSGYGTVHTVKSRLTLPDVSASTVFDVLHDLSYRKNWDLSMIETFDIARLSANVDVGYYAWKCPKPLRNRDVVTLRSWLILPDCYMIINYSVKHKMYPPRKDLVRAVSLQAGYLIEHTGLNSCSLTYTAKVDPRGSLPKWMVNKAAQYLAPKLMRSLYKACQRYPPWKLKNQPDYKPWLYMEQNTLPRMHLGELTLQRAESLEEVDESKASEVKEDSDEDN